jgi:hypothetical protein
MTSTARGRLATLARHFLSPGVQCEHCNQCSSSGGDEVGQRRGRGRSGRVLLRGAAAHSLRTGCAPAALPLRSRCAPPPPLAWLPLSPHPTSPARARLPLARAVPRAARRAGGRVGAARGAPRRRAGEHHHQPRWGGLRGSGASQHRRTGASGGSWWRKPDMPLQHACCRLRKLPVSMPPPPAPAPLSPATDPPQRHALPPKPGNGPRGGGRSARRRRGARDHCHHRRRVLHRCGGPRSSPPSGGAGACPFPGDLA